MCLFDYHLIEKCGFSQKVHRLNIVAHFHLRERHLHVIAIQNYCGIMKAE